MSQNYTTQMDAARKGIITEQMKIVAEKEYMPVEQLRQLGVRMESVNREKYLALLADIYQYDAGNMLYRPDAELDQMVRSDAVKYSVS